MEWHGDGEGSDIDRARREGENGVVCVVGLDRSLSQEGKVTFSVSLSLSLSLLQQLVCGVLESTE
jgi:hypothetical protein